MLSMCMFTGFTLLVASCSPVYAAGVEVSDSLDRDFGYAVYRGISNNSLNIWRG